LAIHRLDLILADRPIPPGLNLRAYNHELGSCGVGFFAHRQIADGYRQDFPRSLHGAPLLMPLSGSVLRRQLDDWLGQQEVVPRIVAEFDDSALMKAFGEKSLGLFPSPVAIADEVAMAYGSELVGITGRIREHFHAISPERKVRHPAVACIVENARQTFLEWADS
jgi:LysR family transcriptional activator of nhaA